MVMPSKKVCHACDQTLQIDSFAKGRAICKECYNKRYREKTKEKIEKIKENIIMEKDDDINKVIEEKKKVIEEKKQLMDENKLLKERLNKLENDVINGKMIDKNEYDRLLAKYEKLAEWLKTMPDPDIMTE